MSEQIRNVSPIGRVYFADVFEPRVFKEGDTPAWSITLLFPKKEFESKEDVGSLSAEIEQAIAAGFPKRPSNLFIPLRDGDEMDAGPYHGNWFAKFKTTLAAPAVVDRAVLPISKESGAFYPGCWAKVSYAVGTFSVPGNKGVSLYLNHVQKVADDDPLSFAPSPTDVFDPVDDDVISSYVDCP